MKKLKVLGCDLDVKISPTFLQSAACPFCLKCKYIDHIENVYIRVNTLRGQAAHEAIAELTQMALDEKMPVQELSDEQVFEAAVRHTPSEIVSEQNNILKWTLLWRDRFKLSKHHFGHEERMALDDAFQECPWDEASYRGIVDILEVAGPHAIVTDYKSQARPMSQHELDNHDQLTHYCWLVDKQYGGEGRGIKRYSGRIWYLQYGFYHQTERTREDLALYEKRMHAQVQKIADISSWDPVPCDHCVVCDFVHICPIAENVSSPPSRCSTLWPPPSAASSSNNFRPYSSSRNAPSSSSPLIRLQCIEGF